MYKVYVVTYKSPRDILKKLNHLSQNIPNTRNFIKVEITYLLYVIHNISCYFLCGTMT